MNEKKLNWKFFAIIFFLLIIIFVYLIVKIKKSNNNQQVNVQAKNIIALQPQQSTKKILYKTDAGLILYDPDTQSKLLILGSDIGNKLIDWDLSKDGIMLVYSVKENDFADDSSVWIKNLQTGSSNELKKTANGAALNAKIFPDDNQIAYVKRTFDSNNKQLSDGEIWIYDFQKGGEQKILGDNGSQIIDQTKIDKNENGNACVSSDDLANAKIGINKISSDGKNISFWKAALAADCGGLIQNSFFVKTDGSNIFSDQFLNRNTFVQTNADGQNEQKKWTIDDVYWLEDGSFVLSDVDVSGQTAVYFFDKDQNKKWTIFDSSDQKFASSGIFSQFSLDDLEVENGKIMLAYELYFDDADDNYYQDGKFVGTKYYLQQFAIGDEITAQKLSSIDPYVSIEGDANDDISNVKILDSNSVYYEKWNDQKQKTDAFIFDLSAKKELFLN